MPVRSSRTSASLVQASLAFIEVPAHFYTSLSFADFFGGFLLHTRRTLQRRRLARTVAFPRSSALPAGSLLIQFGISIRRRTARIVRRRGNYRRRHGTFHARLAEAGASPPVEGLRAPRTVTGRRRRIDRSTSIAHDRRRIARGLLEILARLAELEDGRFAAGRVQALAVRSLGAPRRACRAGIITGTPGRALLLVLVGAPKLAEVEVRVGRLRVVLGRKLEDQRRAGRFRHRLSVSWTPLFADRQLLLMKARERRQLSRTPRRLHRLSGTAGCHLRRRVCLTDLPFFQIALSLTDQYLDSCLSRPTVTRPSHSRVAERVAAELRATSVNYPASGYDGHPSHFNGFGPDGFRFRTDENTSRRSIA